MYRQLAGRLLIAALTVLLPLVTLVTPASAALVCADLVVTGLSVNPPSPIAGQSVQVNVTVKNQGTCDVTTGFVVQWQSSSFGGDTLGGTLTELDAGQSQTLTFPYIFTKAGNFLTTATVDSGKAVPETIESNNSRLLSVTVQAATTDLIVSSIVFTPNPAVATDPTHVAITLQNTGNTDAGPFTAQWVSQPNAKAITQQYPGLAAGASILWEFDYTYTRAGSFDTVATVDTGNDVKETNENNNSLTVPLTVDPPLADLIVTNVSINPTNPIAGQPAVVTVTVQNVGHRATDVTNPGDFVVQWKPAPTEQPLTQQVNGPLAERRLRQVDAREVAEPADIADHLGRGPRVLQ